ncbi:MAG: aminodeoxychorismate/anthranilate synthase component II [Bacteroidales bacterium]|nr:aminodeoxychorismate/anthranilate synthase component II [Bacteroidales bacterium]
MEKVVVIDNYDSFTYNLVHALSQITGSRVDVFRNDRVKISDLEEYSHFVLSPGPGIPDEAGMLKEIIRNFAPRKRMLGVCLGHQAIAEVFGGKLINIQKVFHGVSTPIRVLDKEDYLYRNIPENFEGGRYHSWIVSGDDLPPPLKVTALAEDGEIMGMSHLDYDVKGVQFHPESILTKCGTDLLTNWIIGDETDI